MVFLWLLLGILLFGSLAQGGLDKCDMWNRISWLYFFALVAVALTIQNVWAALCVAMIAGGMLTVIPKSDLWVRAGLPALAAAATYAALAPQMTPALIEPLLWGFVGIGCWIGLWTDYSRQQGFTGYQHYFPRPPAPAEWWSPIAFHEDARTHLKAGQGNSNHLQCAAVLCLAAMFGLVMLGRWGALLAWPLLVQPLIRRLTRGTRWGQGHLHAMSLAVLAISIWSGSVFVLCLLMTGYVAGLAWIAKPWTPRQWWLDGNRLWLWHRTLRAWRTKLNWRQRLFGYGTGTWQVFSTPLTVYEPGNVIYTTAHNEYVQWLVEHGLIGTFLLTGYLLDAGARLWHGGVEGHALLLVAGSLLSIATTNFPWSWFHEISRLPECQTCKQILAQPYLPRPLNQCQCERPIPTQPLPYYVGSPTLLAMSLVIAIAVEAF